MEPDAIEGRHHNVRDDQIDLFRFEKFSGFLPFFGRKDFVPPALKET
jgi:hypothetical protein